MSFRFLFTLSLVVAMASCESDDVSEESGNFDSMDVSNLQAVAKVGEWRVATYTDHDDSSDDSNDDSSDDSNLTAADFSGYSFQFNEDGSLRVVNGDMEYTGTWKVYLDDNSNDDSPDNDNMEFVITLSTTVYALQELVEDWDVFEFSANKIHLIDYDEENGTKVEDEVLVFEKI